MWSFSIFAKFSTCKKFQNHKIAKLNICRVWDSPFPNVWSKYDIDTRTSHVSTYSNENRVLVTYSIIVTLIRNRKIKIQSDFRFLFLLNLWNKIPAKCFAITKLWNAILINKFWILTNHEIKCQGKLIPSRQLFCFFSFC